MVLDTFFTPYGFTQMMRDHGQELCTINWFAEIVVATGFDALLAVLGHCVAGAAGDGRRLVEIAPAATQRQ